MSQMFLLARRTLGLGLLAVSTLTAGTAAAQQSPTTQPGRAAPASSQASSTSKQKDQQLADLLLAPSQNAVAISQMASQRAKHPDVQKLARRLIEDHQQFISKLEKFSTSASSSRNGGSGQSTQTSGQSGQQGQSSQQGQSGQLDIVSLQRELAAECLKSVRAELEEKQGAEFDKAFIGMQIGAHMAAADMLKVFQRHATSELKQVLSEGHETERAHLDEAKQIMRKLESSSAAETSQRPSRQDNK